MKRYVAYSSILHMRVIVLKRFRVVVFMGLGVILMRVGHGFISAGMFFIVSLIYNYVKRRKVFYLGGLLNNKISLFFFCGLCLVLKGSAPIRIKFFGEFLLLLGGVFYMSY